MVVSDGATDSVVVVTSVEVLGATVDVVGDVGVCVVPPVPLRLVGELDTSTMPSKMQAKAADGQRDHGPAVPRLAPVGVPFLFAVVVVPGRRFAGVLWRFVTGHVCRS